MLNGFDVYDHSEKGQVGIGRELDKIIVVSVQPDGECSREEKPLVSLAGLVVKLVREGYRKRAKAFYLSLDQQDDGVVKATFTRTHPDLSSDDLGEYIMFVPKPQGLAEDIFATWDQQLNKLSPSWPSGDDWLRKQKHATDCIAAFTDHPAMALLIGQWALENKFLVVSKLKGLPTSTPRENPLGWVDYLKGTFPERQLQTCAADLGMSVLDLFKKLDEEPRQPSVLGNESQQSGVVLTPSFKSAIF